MKRIGISLALALVCGGFTACDTDYEPLNLQPAKQYSEKYYQNLRNYKSNMFDRSICFVWFADYNGDPSTPAYRFSALPDSVDICSLWGGYPDPVQNSLAYKEMWEMRNKKGTLLVAPTIIRIMENENYANFGLTYEDMVNQTTTDDPTEPIPTGVCATETISCSRCGTTVSTVWTSTMSPNRATRSIMVSTATA